MTRSKPGGELPGGLGSTTPLFALALLAVAGVVRSNPGGGPSPLWGWLALSGLRFLTWELLMLLLVAEP